MAPLMSVLYTVLALAGGLLMRVISGLALVGLALIILLPVLFAFYWMVVVYDGLVGIRRVGQLSWRLDSYYTPGHLWLRPMRSSLVRVGVDDIGRRVLPDVEAISLSPPGTHVDAGQPIADIRCGHGNVVLRSPVDGTIAYANPRVVRAPKLLNRDSYRRAWLVDIHQDEAVLDRWVSGTRARTWLADEERRLSNFFEHALGVAAADGGELMRTGPATLTDDQWREARASFLDGSSYINPSLCH